jgi:hypothetical protein
MTTNATDAPLYIDRDTYTGRHTVINPKNLRPEAWTAAELAAHAPTGVIWESFGNVSARREGFCRTRYVADADGNLHCYASDGHKVIIHPARRTLRILVG